MYDAWGNALAGSAGNTPNPFTWNGAFGYEWIPFTGLYHVGAREYDPRTARWLQRDPIGVAGGHPNLSLYCANDPVNGKDPSGLQDEGGGFWYHFFRELLKGETWTNGINTGLAATGSAFTFGLWDGGAYRNEVGFETSFLLAGIGRDCLITAGTLGAGEAIVATKTAGTVVKQNNSLLPIRQVGTIKGYTKHGINQAISREGSGVKTQSILDAVRNPTKVQVLSNGRIKYIGKDAIVVLNREGKVITTWAKSSSATRCANK